MSAEPTFGELMADQYLTPKRKPVLDHASVAKAAVEWLWGRSGWWWILTEMLLPQRHPSRVADVVAWNQRDRQFFVIEAKADWRDFYRDRKFLDYRRWCHWFAFALPEELAPCARRRMDDVPGWYAGAGLLVISSQYGPRHMARRPKKQPMTEETYQQMIEQCAASAGSKLAAMRMDLTDARINIDRLEAMVRQLKGADDG